MFPPARPESRKAEPTITSPSSSAIFQPFATLNYNDSVDGGNSNIVYRQPSRALYCIISERRASVCFPIEYPTVGTRLCPTGKCTVCMRSSRVSISARDAHTQSEYIYSRALSFFLYVCMRVCV